MEHNQTKERLLPFLRRPRLVRWTDEIKQSRRQAQTFILLLAGLLLFWGIEDVANVQKLATEGVTAKATVESKVRRSEKNYRLYWTATVEGKTLRGKTKVSEGQYDSTPVGGEIALTYLRGKPSVRQIGPVTEATIAKRQRRWLLLGGLGSLLIGVWALVVESDRHQQFRLLQNGAASSARITNRFIQQEDSPVYFVKYAYRAAKGHGDYRDGQVQVCQADYERLASSNDFVVLFNPDEPEEHRPLFQITAARLV